MTDEPRYQVKIQYSRFENEIGENCGDLMTTVDEYRKLIKAFSKLDRIDSYDSSLRYKIVDIIDGGTIEDDITPHSYAS